MDKKQFIYLTTSAIVASYSAPSIASMYHFSNISNIYAANELTFDSSSQANFVKSIAPYAKKIGAENDVYASIMIAQAALESGSGTSKLATAANNLFGMKEKNGGPSYVIDSKEQDKDGKEYIQESAFKKFESQLACLEYYPNHFKQTAWYKNYYKGIYRSESSSYKQALQALDGKYATDLLYITKLQKLIDQYDLTQYDVQVEQPETKPVEPIETKPVENIPSPNPSTQPTTPKDTTAPNEVSNLKTTVTTEAVTLTFVKPKDSDFSHVVILRDGKTIADKVTATSYQDKGLKEGTKYTYTIKTVDKTGNVSKGNGVATTTAKKPVQNTTTYTVQKGDTLSSIARKYNTTYQKLMSLNSLKTTSIKVGQQLKVTGTATTIITTTPAKTIPASSTQPKTITTTTKTGKVKASTLNMRSGAGAGYKIVGTLVKNQVVTINSMSGKWAYVTYGSKKGYVNTDYLTITTTNATTANTTTKTVSTPKATVKTHTVQKGDTLTSIGKKYNVSVANLKSWNKLTSNNIRIGQKLNVSK